jgi:hypothetical protein
MPALLPLTQAELIQIFKATTPISFWQPLLADPNSSSVYNAIAAVLERVAQAVYNADLQSYILDATNASPSVGLIVVTAPGGAVDLPGGTQLVVMQQTFDGRGNVLTSEPSGRFYFLTQGYSGSPAEGTQIALEAQSVNSGYATVVYPNEILTFTDSTLAAAWTIPIFVPTLVPASPPAGYTVGALNSIQGGLSNGLGLLGASRGIYQGAGELQEAYRKRIRRPLDVVTPVALLRVINSALAAYGVTGTLQEPFGIPYPASDAPGYAAPPPGLILAPLAGFADATSNGWPWFFDQGAGPGLAGDASVGPVSTLNCPSFAVNVPIPKIDPGPLYAFSDYQSDASPPPGPRGFFDSGSYGDLIGAPLTPVQQAELAVIQAVSTAKAGGVAWTLTP